MAKSVAALDPAMAASFYTDDVVGMAVDAPVVQGKTLFPHDLFRSLLNQP